ncbi:MAG: TQXA domain-containing protein, partial [Clostridia bacterium]|nr:TQXA domain-containing protein [Clostridia bacterium]
MAKMKKFLVLALAAILCIMSFAIPALADDVVVENTEETLTVTTTTATGEDGEEVVTVTIEKTEEIQTEKSETTGDVLPGQDVPDVEIELVPGESKTESVFGTVTEVTGDLPESADDKDFDFTSTTTTTDREVTAEAGKIVVEIVEENTNLDCSVAPEDYEGKKYDNPGKLNGLTNQPIGLQNGTKPDYGFTPAAKPEEEGYDYMLSGNGDATYAAAPVFMNVVYVRDEAGNPVKDAEGNFVIDTEKSTLVYAGEKAGNSGMTGSPSQLALKKDGEFFYTYCTDKVTPAIPGAWYKVQNLEDTDYYPDEESADKIRAIVTNGYWGTEEGTGSLESIKQLLRDTYGENDTVTVKDKDGKEYTYNIASLIDGLAEHEALAVTQAAIWSFSNGCLATQNGADGIALIGVQSSLKCFNGANQDSGLDQYKPAYNLESDARLKALFDCMMGLEGIPATNNDVTTVINEKNAVEDMTLVIGDKAEGRVENTDNDDDNDVYESGVNFTLAFVPDPKTDDLLVYLTDANGEVINDANGKPIVRRLAGENSEGREADTIEADENGVYTLTGLQLQENSDITFDLRLEGTQYLKEGVYVYSTFGGRDASQTLVGLAEGERDVEVSVGMTISFEVDESNKIVAERVWRKSSSSSTTTKKDPSTTTTVITEEGVPLTASADGLVEIIDEEVPLADAPETGDNSIVYVLVSL